MCKNEHHSNLLYRLLFLHVGLIYEATARDEDSKSTCNPNHPCPCGENTYDIVSEAVGLGVFDIDTNTGDLSVKSNAKLNPGDYFKVEVAVTGKQHHCFSIYLKCQHHLWIVILRPCTIVRTYIGTEYRIGRQITDKKN